MKFKVGIVYGSLSFFYLLSICLLGTEIDSKRLIEAKKEPHNWMTYSGTYNAWRYSQLDQINQENVNNLVPVWVFQTGIVDGGFSCTPLVVDGVMYITTP